MRKRNEFSESVELKACLPASGDPAACCQGVGVVWGAGGSPWDPGLQPALQGPSTQPGGGAWGVGLSHYLWKTPFLLLTPQNSCTGGTAAD